MKNFKVLRRGFNWPIFIILFATLVVSGFFIFINKAQARTWYVCPEISGECTHVSIQVAIDAADVEDTINVAAGTYEEIITIAKPLTLRGATYDVNKNGYSVPENYAWEDSIETIIQNPDSDPTGTVVKITSDDVIFEGFIVQSLNRITDNYGNLIEVQADGHGKDLENIDIINNVIGPNTNVVDQDGNKGRMNLYIAINQYQETPWGLTGSLISGNKIFGSEGNGNVVFIWGAYYAYGARNPSPMSGTIIEDNEISNGHRTGIEIAGGVSDLVIRNNNIHDFSSLVTDSNPTLLKYGSGIVLIRGSSDKIDCNGLSPMNLTIENNEIYDNEKNAIYMGPNNNGVTINNNDLHDNRWDAVKLDLIGNYWNPDFETSSGPYTCLGGSENVVSNYNNIYNNDQYGVSVNGEPTNGFILDSKNNWWGATTGPNTEGADSTEGDVDFAPFYTDAAMTTESTEYSVCASGCNFVNIQDAIDAATSGDIINVAAGTYTPTSTININKNGLTLLGPQANVDPRPSQDSSRTAGSEEEAIIDGDTNGLDWIIKIDADNIVINGLEVKSGTEDMISQYTPHSGTEVKYSLIHDGRGDEGVQLKQCTNCTLEYNYVFEIADAGDGLNIADSSSYGVIRYNEVAGIHGENAAIYIYGAEHMEISNNLVRDSGIGGNDGIKVGSKDGSDALKIDVLIKDNVIHDITQDGISVYMSEVTVEGNEIYNCGSENGAIYLAYEISDITIQNNNIHDNLLSTSKRPTSAGILLENRVDAVNVDINFNNIYNNVPYGITNEASALLNARNNYWGHPTGPSEEGPGEGPGEGDAVSENVSYSPWYTDDKLTSLKAPIAEDTETGNKVLALEQSIDIISNDIIVSMPAGITITATASWEGIINVPSIETVALDTPPPESGHNTTIDTIIEIGYSNIKLVFDKAVKILIPNQAGKRVGYVRPDEDFQEITNVCSNDIQPTDDSFLPPEGDCKRDVDNDLVVWTKHFTQFIVYSYSPIIITPTFRAETPPEPEPEEEPSPLSEEAQKLDTNKDEKIDDLDLKELFANWGSIILDNIADFNNDSKVDVFDFNLLMVHWTE